MQPMQHQHQQRHQQLDWHAVPHRQQLLQRPVLQKQHHQQQQPETIPLLSLSSLHPDLQQLVQQRQRQRQQHQKQQAHDALMPHPLCQLQPANLTRRITNCSSWRDVAVLFAQQAPCLNHVNLSALLVTLARLPGPPSSRPANWQPFVRQVLATSQPLLQFAQPRQLSNMAWALAKLGLRDWAGSSSDLQSGDSSSSSSSSSSGGGCEQAESGSRMSWGSAWQQQVVASLHTASCRDVSNILWALATSSSSSSSDAPAQQHPHWQYCQQQQQQHQQQQQQSPANLLAGSRLGQELLSALHRTLPNSAPQDVANTLWALATLQLRPSPELLAFCLIRLQSHFAALQPREVATSLWALAQLQAAPPSSWLQECLLRQVGRPQWQDTQVRHWVMCLTACAHLKQVPPTAWLTECLSKLQTHMAGAAPTQQQQQQQQEAQPLGVTPLLQQQQGAATATDAAHQLADSIAAAVLAASLSSGSSPRSSSTGPGGNARAQKRTTTSSSGSSRTTSRSSSTTTTSTNTSSTSTAVAQSLSPQDLANTIWALATLHIKPNAAWMAAFLGASAASLSAAGPQELVNCMWGLQMLRVVPTATWLAVFDAASLACMETFTPQGLGDILAAQARLGLRPSWVWGEAWASALKACWDSADAPAVVKTLWAAAKCQLPLGRAWLGEALVRVHKPLLLPALALGGLTNEELLRLMWAVGRLCRGNLSQELSNLLGLYCCRAAGKMSGVQLARGAWGMARLVPLPREGLVSHFHDLAASKLKYLPAAEAGELDQKLSLLRDAAAKTEVWGSNWRVVLARAEEQQQEQRQERQEQEQEQEQAQEQAQEQQTVRCVVAR